MKIKLYQINLERDAEKGNAPKHAFREYNRKQFRKDIYDLVFEGSVDAKTLDEVFEIFNIDHPEGYKGRSLSVSDVVEVISTKPVPAGAYYCQRFGWLPIVMNEKGV